MCHTFLQIAHTTCRFSVCTAVQDLWLLQHTQIWCLTSIQIVRCSTFRSCSKTSVTIRTGLGTTSKNLSSERYWTSCWSRPKSITAEFFLWGLLCKYKHPFVHFSHIIMWWMLVSRFSPFFSEIFFFPYILQYCILNLSLLKKKKSKSKQKTLN